MKKLQILGTGCSKCAKLFETTETAATGLGVAYQIEKITDLQKIMSFGVMMTPALVVDGVVKQLNVEEGGKFEVSNAETMLAQLA